VTNFKTGQQVDRNTTGSEFAFAQQIPTNRLLFAECGDFKRAAFYNGLKSKVGLAAAKAAALRVNLNVQGCGIVAPPMHASCHDTTLRRKKKSKAKPKSSFAW
jgi:hypothetical protein